MKVNIIAILSIVTMGLLSSSCGKEEARYSIPWALVSYEIGYNQDPELQSLQGFKTFTKARLSADRFGFGGLLVVHGMGDGTPTLHAYDLSCPHESQQNIRVETFDGMTAKCNKCGSVFEIFNGTGRPTSGPASERLQKYNVRANGGSGSFRVTN